VAGIIKISKVRGIAGADSYGQENQACFIRDFHRPSSLLAGRTADVTARAGSLTSEVTTAGEYVFYPPDLF